MEWISKETWFFSLSVLINEDFNCQNYITSVTDNQMQTWHCYNDTDKEKQKY